MIQRNQTLQRGQVLVQVCPHCAYNTQASLASIFWWDPWWLQRSQCKTSIKSQDAWILEMLGTLFLSQLLRMYQIPRAPLSLQDISFLWTFVTKYFLVLPGSCLLGVLLVLIFVKDSKFLHHAKYFMPKIFYLNVNPQMFLFTICPTPYCGTWDPNDSVPVPSCRDFTTGDTDPDKGNESVVWQC